MSSVTVTNKQIILAVRALLALDKQDDKGRPAYRFGPKVRLAILKRLRQLKALADDIEASQIATQREAGVSHETVPREVSEGGRMVTVMVPREDWSTRTAMNKKIEEFLATKQTLEIGKLKLSDLCPDAETTNDIPVAVLTELGWLLEDEPAT